jgi:hypothetical protein
MHRWPLLRIGVVEDDGGRLAAELEGDPLDLLAADRTDPAPHAGAAGEADLVDERMPDQFLTHRAVGRHHVQHTRWQPGRRKGLGEQERVERRLLGRLEHHRASGQQRGAQLGHGQPEREVPGDDRAHHPDRLPPHLQPREDPGPVLHPGIRAGLVGVPVEHGLRHGHLDAGLPDRGADFEHRQPGELVRAGLDLLTRAAQDRGPSGRRRPRPRTAIEGRSRRAHRTVHIGHSGQRRPSDRLLGERIDHIDRSAVHGLGPFPAHVEKLTGNHLCLHLCLHRRRGRA